MKDFILRFVLCLFAVQSVFSVQAAKNPYKLYYKNSTIKMPEVTKPVFPNRKVSVADFGGRGDGKFLNTEAFAGAMNFLSSRGGGTLQVPFGVWFTGPIEFKSNINLHLDKGALILFTPDKKAYPLVSASFEGVKTMRCQSPITARNAENIAITGEGAINGSGESWRPLKKSKVTEVYWKSVLKSGGVLKNPDLWYPSQSALKGALIFEQNQNGLQQRMTESDWESIRDFLRPVMISLVNCKNVFLQGVLFENSPGWNIHPLLCENIIVDGVFIRNPAFAQNGDGIDLESCKNALIVNTVLDVGDDAICLKSGKNEEGRLRGKPTENVIVDNCTVFKGHGGFVVGSEMSGGVKNIVVTNCKFMGTDVGIRFKSTRGRGGVVENIEVNNISMFDIVNESLLFDLYYGGKSATESFEDGDVNPMNDSVIVANETTPVFRNIFIKNIVSRNARRAMFFNGLPEMKINNIRVENVWISAKTGAELSESKDIRFKNITIEPAEGAALILNNISNFEADTFIYPPSLAKPLQLNGVNENIKIDNRVINSELTEKK